jgi:peptidyl-tRNA hydrolase
VIARRDLPLGLLAAQIVHAAGESSPGRLPPGAYAVVLAVADERELSSVHLRLEAAGLRPHAVREHDPPWNGALMAVGVPPGPRAAIRRHLSSLPLLKDVLPASA